jgi:hypothetical protein
MALNSICKFTVFVFYYFILLNFHIKAPSLHAGVLPLLT